MMATRTIPYSEFVRIYRAEQDEAAIERQVERLLAAWHGASEEARQRFLTAIRSMS